MNDGIIKNDGTSRFIRSVSDFKVKYPTYDAFVEALIAGNFPVDVLFNENGWSQKPDFLNKASLLKDETAALFTGLPENPVPDDVFQILSKAALVVEDGGFVTPGLDPLFVPFVETGSYIGTGRGASGTADTPTSIAFSGVPSSVLILAEHKEAMSSFFVPVFELTESYKRNGYHGFSDNFTLNLGQSTKKYARFLKESNTLQIYINQSGRPYDQADENGKKYYFVAFLVG